MLGLGARLLLALKLHLFWLSSTIGRQSSRNLASATELYENCEDSSSEQQCQPTNVRFFSGMARSSNLSPLFPEQVLNQIRGFIPPLTFDQHKGQLGRIGVIGGSEEYTGAPYFAAISALKLGADLAHVFCTGVAAPVIKSYSPELIVHPLLDHRDAREKILEWIPRLHTVVIGPGLGRDQDITNTVLSVMEDLKELQKPFVIDADGLFMVTKNLNSVRGYKNAILTPNAIEFQRLAAAIGNISIDDDIESTASASKALGGLVIARKMNHDVISDGEQVLKVLAKGSPRRCGGQGDLLSGAAAVFFHWALLHKTETAKPMDLVEYRPGILSAYAACFLSKHCAEAAFQKYGRSTTTSDLIKEIHHVFDKYFETTNHKL